jgi:hypothetical protein
MCWARGYQFLETQVSALTMAKQLTLIRRRCKYPIATYWGSVDVHMGPLSSVVLSNEFDLPRSNSWSQISTDLTSRSVEKNTNYVHLNPLNSIPSWANNSGSSSSLNDSQIPFSLASHLNSLCLPTCLEIKRHFFIFSSSLIRIQYYGYAHLFDIEALRDNNDITAAPQGPHIC